MSEYSSFDATALAGLVTAGEVTAAELVESAQRACQSVNAELNAVVEVYEDPRIPQAVDPAAVFAGVPFLTKDFGAHEKGRRQWMGSRAVDDRLTATESPLARRFGRAGLISIGRSATCEFAVTATVESARFGPTRNPWDLSRTAGGSSGGAAAAVAAGIVPMAHATDSGGSIRIPAACCGLVGLKPTRGVIPTGTTDSVQVDFHTEFVITRSVRDAARALSSFRHSSAGSPGLPTGHRKRKIAVATQASWLPDVDPAMAAATWHTARICGDLGHSVEEAAPQVDWPPLFEAMKDVWALGTLDTVRAWCDLSGAARRPAGIEGLTWDLVVRAQRLTRTGILDAISKIDGAVGTFAAFFDEYDMLLTPTLPSPPPPIGVFSPDMDLDSYYRSSVGMMEPAVAIFNATGQPAISVPAGLSDGLPVGVQIAAGSHQEPALLSLAAMLESEIGWARWTPPVHAGPHAPTPDAPDEEGHSE
ncbi:amidase family protein [Mycobacterium sp. ITM-2016-00317]|uniref:amidase n=1 Tax=Mycobacterium sp. ITM-2016-00317 TaxID=2099694 RepID=UPI00287FE10A|nr:amidase family protein [Mycobacterium sp. ITM-2016-00317]WNG86775.1 amidase family protein [Mycobacterium sp. ITM-2016-00317]